VLRRAGAIALIASLVGICLASNLQAGYSATEETQKNDALLSLMQQELLRGLHELSKLDPAPYFLSYSVHDQNLAVAIASQGSLINSTHLRTRSADVVMRIGSPKQDNTHGENRPSAISTSLLPLEDDGNAISRVFWQLTYREYRKAAQAFANVQTQTQVQAQEEDNSPDFSREATHDSVDYRDNTPFDQSALEQLVKTYSAPLRTYSYVYSSTAMILAMSSQDHFASTEATHIVTPNSIVRLAIQAETRADDGMELVRVETFQGESVDHLPKPEEVLARIHVMALDLKALRSAPVAEPFDGPALLSGRAAAVFFHEVLGHRLEGHRQRGEQEGQTFAKSINQRVLPEFLSIVDDPTARSLDGTDLSGWYSYDDEGVPASRVEVVTDGILKNFLMSRMPVKNFQTSNGHGRAQTGLMPTGRQGNLIVLSSRTVKDSELRQKLIEEIKKQNKPYGLYFEDIQGGFTLTQRAQPQVFQVLPVIVWRVYPDGRPDELVRGVDIVGTPLAAMNRIQLTGEKIEVFNGMCGAESGTIPVSAAAPAMLFSEIEVQKRAHSLNRPPILPPPDSENDTPGSNSHAGGRS
jgi:TldD protein